MKRAVQLLRVCIRDAHPDAIARVTTAGTLGAMALRLARVDASDVPQALMMWWGAAAGIYGAILLAAAPADPDQSNT